MTQATPHQRDIAGESWDPGQYLKFADHRLRPALDLMGRIPLENPKVIYDLGCGSGNVARLLADRWPAADIVGVDNSPEMLTEAADSPSRVRWEYGDLADWKPDASPSVLYSNAVIQWVPRPPGTHSPPVGDVAVWRMPGCAGADELGYAISPHHARNSGGRRNRRETHRERRIAGGSRQSVGAGS